MNTTNLFDSMINSNYYKLLNTFKELTIEVEEFKNSLNFYEIREELTNLRGSPNVKEYLKKNREWDDSNNQDDEFKEKLKKLRVSPNVEDFLKMKSYYDDISEKVEEFKDEELYYYHIREELQDLKLIINNNN